MTENKVKSILLIFILSIVLSVHAQVTPEKFKAVLVFKLAQYITWEKDSKMDTLMVGVLEDDGNVFREMEILTKTGSIRKKKIVVKKINKISDISNINLLYADSLYSSSIRNIWKVISQKNILLVTEMCPDKHLIMIDIQRDKHGGDLTFSINKNNIVKEKFTINPELLLVGGSNVDIKELYRETFRDLLAERKTIKKQKRILKELKDSIKHANDSIARYDEVITLQKKDIDQQKQNLKKLLEKINKRTADLNIQKEHIQKQYAQLEEYKKKIKVSNRQLWLLENEIKKSKKILTGQEKILKVQSNQLKQQTTLLKAQTHVIYFVIILVVLLLITAFFIYRAYYLKRNANILLERRVKERTTDLEKTNVQLRNEIKSRVETENALTSSEKLYRGIFNATADAIFVYEVSSEKILDFNDGFIKIFGYSKDMRSQLTIKDISSDDYNSEDVIKERIEETIVTGHQLFEWQAKRRCGASFWCDVSLQLLDATKGSRVLLVLRDISERKNAQKEKEELQERVRQSEKLEAIGQLAGGIAHDFNNQLTGISGFGELLKIRGETDPELADYAKNILTAVKRSSDLTRQLLAFARKGKYLEKSVNIHVIIEEVLELLKHSIDKKIKLVSNLNAVEPITIGDPTQLQNAILNLAINARDAMPEGGEIRISTKNVELNEEWCKKHKRNIKAGEYISVAMTDQGGGIPKELLERIFEPFFTTKPKGKGTGMGLAAVYGTIINHAGAVDVQSELNVGTTFTLFLPKDTTIQYDVKKEDDTDNVVRGTGSVLYIDDEEFLLNMAKRLFSNLGYNITTCASGLDALKLYEEKWNTFDIILLDMQMPEINGKKLFPKLMEINPKAKIILCSGYSRDEDTQSLLNMGAIDFLEKPFHIDKLYDIIESTIKSDKQDVGN